MSFPTLRFPSPTTGGALLCVALATAACSTPEERIAQKQAEAANMMALYGPACSRLGFAVDSDPWRNCIVNLSTKDELQRYGTYPGYYPWGPSWRGGAWGRW